MANNTGKLNSCRFM